MRLALALALVMTAGLARADAPEVSPRPLPNPALAAGAAKVTVTMSMADHPRAATRPPARPEVAETDVATAVAAKPVTLKSALGSLFPLDAVPRPPKKPKINVTGEEIEDVSYRTQPGPEIIVGRKGSVCGDPAIRGMSVAPIAGRLNGCGLSDGVKVTSVDGVPLSVPATIDCTTALALRSWVTDGLKPVVGKRGGGVARIEVAGSYACRPRNNQSGQQISEHGRGKAVDITGIILKDGEVITVLRDWGRGKQGEILAGIHWVACHSFGTVLGPAANSFHRDHFHFDTAKNRRAGGYCR